MPEPFNLVINGAVFFYKRIRMGDIRLRLIIIVIGNEKLNRIFRKELFKLTAQLRRQRFIVRQNERRALELLDDLRHRIGFSRAGDTQKRLLLKTHFHTVRERLYRLRLIPGGRIFTDNLKVRHILPHKLYNSYYRRRDY